MVANTPSQLRPRRATTPHPPYGRMTRVAAFIASTSGAGYTPIAMMPTSIAPSTPRLSADTGTGDSSSAGTMYICLIIIM